MELERLKSLKEIKSTDLERVYKVEVQNLLASVSARCFETMKDITTVLNRNGAKNHPIMEPNKQFIQLEEGLDEVSREVFDIQLKIRSMNAEAANTCDLTVLRFQSIIDKQTETIRMMGRKLDSQESLISKLTSSTAFLFDKLEDFELRSNELSKSVDQKVQLITHSKSAIKSLVDEVEIKVASQSTFSIDEELQQHSRRNQTLHKVNDTPDKEEDLLNRGALQEKKQNHRNAFLRKIMADR